jgi:metal-dependent hydrolase (beta-lactamase superfamily II)
MKEKLMDEAQVGSISACHPSGWIQTDMFTKWFDNFVHFESLRQMILSC